MTARRSRSNNDATSAMPSAEPLRHSKTLVFISHDSRDAEIAEAFANLLSDVSAGTLKSFRSSDKKGATGIEFGAEWASSITKNLENATDVVALLTQRSIDRPWILYETGFAKGRLNTTVFGVAIGVPLERISTGPFGQFQNSADDEDSLTKLVLQLLARNPDAAPRDEAVRVHIRDFRAKLATLLDSSRDVDAPPAAAETPAAKLFEEVKIMIRELPDKIGAQLGSMGRRPVRRAPRIHPGMIEQLLLHPGSRESPASQAAAWMIVISSLREDYPWLYDIGLDLYHALRAGDDEQIERAREAFELALRAMSQLRAREFLTSDDEEAFLMIRHLPEMLEPLWSRFGRPTGRTRNKKHEPVG